MDTPRVLLEHYLKQLRLPTMLREFPKLAEQCAKQAATFEQFLLRLVEQELLDRERRATERRIQAAKFPVSKSLETYDFLAIPSLNKKLVVELARCEWIGRRENVLALGNSGTGKTHIGLALGLAACQEVFASVSPPRRRWCTNRSKRGMTSGCCAFRRTWLVRNC